MSEDAVYKLALIESKNKVEALEKDNEALRREILKLKERVHNQRITLRDLLEARLRINKKEK